MYSSVDAISLLLNSLGYTSVRYESNTKTTKFFILTDQDRSVQLQKIHKSIPKSTLFPRSYHSSKGHVQTEDKKFVFVTKPLSRGATENLRINASKLTKLGDLKILDLFGYKNVECQVLNSKSNLVNSVLDELDSNPQISQEIRNTWHSYFTDSKVDPLVIPWSGNTGFSEKNELGKYLGEILLGYLAFKSKIPYITKPSSIIFPKSCRFCGIDLAIEGASNLTYFSHKFGIGSKASFFTNFLPGISKRERRITSEMPLYGILMALDSVDGDINRAKEIVYHYGIRSILNIGKSRIKYPFEDTYRSIVNKTPNTDAINLVVSQIKKRCDRKSIIQKLNKENGYSSLTSYFVREMASKLNSCPKSMKILSSILAEKDFYQANLDTEKWLNGEISYSWVDSKKATINFSSKTSVSDITGVAGLVGYTMK